jgi:hypothetical protein
MNGTQPPARYARAAGVLARRQGLANGPLRALRHARLQAKMLELNGPDNRDGVSPWAALLPDVRARHGWPLALTHACCVGRFPGDQQAGSVPTRAEQAPPVPAKWRVEPRGLFELNDARPRLPQSRIDRFEAELTRNKRRASDAEHLPCFL